ncbi:hypothetical protein EPN90_00080 [Patescibacteria group bacterium]|nr:MAG: hypothetical protein EPN90_00080 [Patescibacteria group bacterium]
MSTTKYRVNLSVSTDLKRALQKLAKRDHTSVATKAVDLVRTALEIEEDAILLKLAEERETKKGKYVPHDAAWV